MTAATKTDDEIVAAAVDMAETSALCYLPNGSIDWERSLDRIESWLECSVGDTTDAPLIRRIKREVRKALRD